MLFMPFEDGIVDFLAGVLLAQHVSHEPWN